MSDRSGLQETPPRGTSLSRKVMLIGIDGGELNLIKEWKSVLHHLARLMYS